MIPILAAHLLIEPLRTYRAQVSADVPRVQPLNPAPSRACAWIDLAIQPVPPKTGFDVLCTAAEPHITSTPDVSPAPTRSSKFVAHVTQRHRGAELLSARRAAGVMAALDNHRLGQGQHAAEVLARTIEALRLLDVARGLWRRHGAG